MAAGVDIRFPNDPVVHRVGINSGESEDHSDGSEKNEEESDEDIDDFAEFDTRMSPKQSFKDRFMSRIERAKADAGGPSRVRSSIVAANPDKVDMHRKQMEEAKIRAQRAVGAKKEQAQKVGPY